MAEQPLKDSTEEDEPAARSNAGPSNIEVGGIHIDGNVYGNFILGNNNTINNIVQGYGELLTRYDTNVRNFLEYYLGTEGHPVPFGGREKDLQALDRWLMDNESPHYAMLAAPAGRGKSALLAQWVTGLQSRPAAPHIIFFPISLRFETHLESVAFAALAARAGYLFDEKVANTPDVKQYRGLFADFLNRPHPDGKPTLVVLDGLDEAANWTIGLDIFPPNPPNHLKVLIAARPLAGDHGPEGWLDRLGWNGPHPAYTIQLHTLKKEGVQDILKQMRDPLDRLSASFNILDALYHLTQGDPLLVRLYVDALVAQQGQASLFRPEDIQNLEPGLTGFFKRWFEEQQKLWGDKTSLKDKGVRELLNLCAAAEGPLSKDDVLAIESGPFEGDPLLLEETAKDLSRFIIGDGLKAGYVFSHPQLKEYFSGPMEKRRLEWQMRFVTYGWSTVRRLKSQTLAPKNVPPYVLQYYTTHLRNIKAPFQAYYELVCRPWAQAWLAFEGTYSGFLNDVGHAWDFAERTDNLPVQLLCALCFSSINSRGQNISAQLLALAAKEEIISIRQGLIMIEQQSSFHEIAEKLGAFTHELADDRLKEGFRLALTMGSWMPLWGPTMVASSKIDFTQFPNKARDLIPLIPPETWELAERNLSDKHLALQIMTLAGLYLHTNRVEYLERLIAKKDQAEYAVGYLLSNLAAHLPSDVLVKTLDLVENLPDEHNRLHLLKSLVPYLPEPLRSETLHKAFDSVQHIEDEGSRAQALLSLAPHLPLDLLDQAFKMARSSLDEADKIRLLLLTMAAVPHLPADLRQKTLEELLNHIPMSMNEDRLSQVLIVLAPHLPADMLFKAFEIARTISDEDLRLDAWVELVPHLPADLLNKAFEGTQDFRNAYCRSRALTALVPHLPEPLRQDALEKAFEAVQDDENEQDRGAALTWLVKYLPGGWLAKALNIAQNIQDEAARLTTLTVIAPYLPEPLRRDTIYQTLRTSQNLHDENARVQTLTAFAPHLSPDSLIKVFKLAQGLRDENAQAQALKALASHLPPDWLMEAFKFAQDFKEDHARARALTALGTHLPEPFRQAAFENALDIAHQSESRDLREETLTALAPYLAAPLQNKALDIAVNIFVEYRRTQALRALAPHLPPDLFRIAYETAQNGEISEWRAELLIALAPYLPDPLRQDALEKAVEAAHHLLFVTDRIKALTALAPYLPEPLRQVTLEKALENELEIAQNMADEATRMWGLKDLIPHLPDPLRRIASQIALETAQNIEDEALRADELLTLAPHVPNPFRQDILRQALAAAQDVTDENRRARILIGLAPHLPPELLNNALATARHIPYDDDRILALSTFVLYVPQERQNQLVQEMINLSIRSLEQNRYHIKNILFSLNNQPAFSILFKKECLKKLIRQSSRLPRKDVWELIPDLYKLACSTVPEAEHKPLAEEMALAILNVGEWWP